MKKSLLLFLLLILITFCSCFRNVEMWKFDLEGKKYIFERDDNFRVSLRVAENRKNVESYEILQLNKNQRHEISWMAYEPKTKKVAFLLCTNGTSYVYLKDLDDGQSSIWELSTPANFLKIRNLCFMDENTIRVYIEHYERGHDSDVGFLDRPLVRMKDCPVKINEYELRDMGTYEIAFDKYLDISNISMAGTVKPESIKIEVEDSVINPVGNDYNEGSVEYLVYEITKINESPSKVTKEIYDWITENIEYDMEGLITGAVDRSAEGTFVNRKSVCTGYAELFCKMCKLAGIDSVFVVIGCVKKESREVKEIRDDRHAWNIVKYSGEWHIVDCTWGAGYVDSSNEFHFNKDEFYFDADPSSLIKTHFPDEERWQMLGFPVTFEEFCQL